MVCGLTLKWKSGDNVFPSVAMFVCHISKISPETTFFLNSPNVITGCTFNTVHFRSRLDSIDLPKPAKYRKY